MKESKTVDIILLIIFVLGIAGLGLFFFSDNLKHMDNTIDTTIEPERSNIKSGHGTSREPAVVSDPISTENRQTENEETVEESHSPARVESLKEPPATKEDTPIPEQHLPKKKDVTPTVLEDEEDHVKDQGQSKEQIEKITLETKKSNGTIFTAQEIPEGVVTGTKADANDRADLYKIRALGKQLFLNLEPEVRTIKDSSVMTIYDGQLKGVGEYFPQKSPRRAFNVTEGEVYYIKLHLSSIDDSSFEYRLTIEFQESSPN